MANLYLVNANGLPHKYKYLISFLIKYFTCQFLPHKRDFISQFNYLTKMILYLTNVTSFHNTAFQNFIP